MPGNKIRKALKTATYTSLSNRETETDNLSHADDDDDDDDDTLLSRSKISQISNLSDLPTPKSSMKSLRKSDDNISKSSKSFSVKTFYRNRRSRNRNQSQNPYHDLIKRPISTTNSKQSISFNWRCDECNYFPNTWFDPHCYKCGAIKHDIDSKLQNKLRKHAVSMTGTTSSSPILAPGSVPHHSSNMSHNNIIVDSSDNTTDDDDDDSSSDSLTDNTSDISVSDDKAIIVQDYRSKTSQSNSRNAIAQIMDIDDNIDIALPLKHSKTMINNAENNDNDISYHRSQSTPKTKEWDAFQWYLGVKRFILAILYLMVTLEEAFILKYVKDWIILPLILCVTYVLLIIYIGRFSMVKYNGCVRSVLLIIFYFINILIIIAPSMNVLIASSKVYDFRDILDRDMFCNNLMWICFAFAIISMVFIDVVIVHNDDDNMNDKYRVETYKLVVVKDEEYVLNNQCLWYTVHRKDWGKIYDKLKQKTETQFVRIGIDNNPPTNMIQEEEECSSYDDDRHSTYSITNIINKSRESKIRRCCTKPFSCLQWTLIFVFFISMQLCVIFAIYDTKEIEKHDVSGAPPQE